MADYNSRQVSISMGGVPLEGFGEDSIVSIEFDSDLITDKIGVDGQVTFSKTNDLRATATVTLMATSPSNAILASFYAQVQRGENSVGAAPFFLKDTISGESITSARAMVMKAPTVEFGSEVTEREWTIRLEKAVYVHAGQTT